MFLKAVSKAQKMGYFHKNKPPYDTGIICLQNFSRVFKDDAIIYKADAIF